jgi:hypothetical protein
MCKNFYSCLHNLVSLIYQIAHKELVRKHGNVKGGMKGNHWGGVNFAAARRTSPWKP